MANTLTAIAPTLYGTMRNISRELIGMIAASNTNFDSKGAAVGDTVKVPRVSATTNSNYTPAMTTTAGADNTPTTDDLTITKTRMNTWNYTHEEKRSMENAGTFAEFMRLRTAEGVRALLNEFEQDLWLEAYRNASRAVGTAGTTPFASNLSATALVRQVLDDNGAPAGDRSLVINTAAGANLRSLTQLTNVGDAGTDATLREGELLRINGLSIRESAQIALHTKGTGSGYLINNGAGYVVGDRTLVLDTGTGTILAGDIVTTAADTTNKYVNNVALASNQITIGRPGLRIAAPDNNALTVGNNYTPNVALHRNALAAAVRPPIIEPNPSMSVMPISDELGKLTVLMCEIIGDGMTTFRLHLAWGVKAISGEHIATLMG